MKEIDSLLQNNRRWVEKVEQEQPGFFQQLSEQQHPEYLWIGCSDSRVPANTIVGLMPGDIFVHRNVANQVIQTDINCLSVIEYAVKALKVKHILVCGHYGCGGVIAALHNQKNGLVDNWLRNVRDIYKRHQAEIDGLADDQARADRLCELNVFEQVRNVCRTTIMQDAWQSGQEISVNGVIYDIKDGLLQDLGISIASEQEVQEKIQLGV
jgi:carbonic anhydrase